MDHTRTTATARRVSPLTARLAIAFVGVALAAVAVLTVLTLVAAQGGVSQLVDQQRHEAVERAAGLAGGAYEQAGGWEDAQLHSAMAVALAEGGSVTLLDADGAPVELGHPDGMRRMMERMHGVPREPAGPPVRAPVLADDQQVGTLEVHFPDDAGVSAASQLGAALTRNVLAAAGLAGLLALVTAGVVASRVTRPLTRLTETVEAVAAGDRTVRSGAADAPGELGVLSRSVDAMADTLERQDELRRALVADVAHELRTPLAVALGECDALIDGVSEPDPDRLASIREEIVRLARLVGDLEALAAAESAGLQLQTEPLDLADVVDNLVALREPRLRADGLHLDVELESAPVQGDSLRLGQIVTNLLDNAAKFSPPEGRVTVRVRNSDPVVLEVVDDGPGVPDEEQVHVFDRFWQGQAAAAGGSGVGLAVVAELTRAHGGRARVGNVAGRGAAFTVELPRR